MKIRSPYLHFILIPLLLFLSASLIYALKSDELPFSYWDEHYWVSTSSHFYILINSGGNSNFWHNTESYDEPNLTKYIYGLWLYPRYKKGLEKSINPNYNYITFLVSNGFYPPHTNILGYYTNNSTTLQVLLKPYDVGNKDELYAKYGLPVIKTLDIIKYARKINILLLSLSIVCFYFFLRNITNISTSLIATLLYALNPLIIRTSLLAHSEALFLLLFNSSLLFMTLYFKNKQSIKYLLLFSITVGLAMSTKLNGIMLFFILIGLVICLKFLFRNKININTKSLVGLFISACIILTVFVSINPSTWSKPITSIQKMFTYRYEIANWQSNFFPTRALLKYSDRFLQIFDNFFGIENYNKFLAITDTKTNYLIWFVYVSLFISGFLNDSYHAIFKKNFDLLLINLTFIFTILITVSYLKLNWDRYFVHIAGFLTYFIAKGGYIYLKLTKHIALRR